MDNSPLSVIGVLLSFYFATVGFVVFALNAYQAEQQTSVELIFISIVMWPHGVAMKPPKATFLTTLSK